MVRILGVCVAVTIVIVQNNSKMDCDTRQKARQLLPLHPLGFPSANHLQ